MTYEVRNITDVDKKNIKLGKTFKYTLSNDNNYNLTNIYYINSNNSEVSYVIKENENKKQESIDEKTKLIIQTPLMYIPKRIIHFNNKPFLELSFNNEDNDKDVLEFKNWIYSLEEYIFNLIKKRTSLCIEKSNLCSIIKNNKNNHTNINTSNTNINNHSLNMLIPLNLNISKCILNEDYNNFNNTKKSKILFNWDIPTPTYAVSIIWIKNIWIKNKKWGINLFMYASRVMNSHILDPIDFMGSDSDNKTIKIQDIAKKFKDDKNASVQIGQIPEYTLYFKMLKMGIPKDAIKQKMNILDLDTRYIDYPETTPYVTFIHYISNPQLGSYVNSKAKPNENDNENTVLNNSILQFRPNIQLNLLNNIKSGEIKLKKVITNDKLSSVVKNTKSLKVPSLGDIQGALSKLKKINLESQSDI
jgi:hypothetical protein